MQGKLSGGWNRYQASNRMKRMNDGRYGRRSNSN